MAKTYKIWAYLEEYDDETDEYQDIGESVEIGEFDNEHDAHSFVGETIGTCEDCGGQSTRLIHLCANHGKAAD